jgi:hypothetical protein
MRHRKRYRLLQAPADSPHSRLWTPPSFNEHAVPIARASKGMRLSFQSSTACRECWEIRSAASLASGSTAARPRNCRTCRALGKSYGAPRHGRMNRHRCGFVLIDAQAGVARRRGSHTLHIHWRRRNNSWGAARRGETVTYPVASSLQGLR